MLAYGKFILPTVALVLFGAVTNDPAAAQVSPPFTVRYTFTGSYDGASPLAPLIQDRAGMLYGVTSAGNDGQGTVFGITPAGSLQLWTFPFTAQTGANSTAGLLPARDGSFYGTTQRDGANGTGTLFQITPFGEFTLLQPFSATVFNAAVGADVNAEGADPRGGLIQGAHGNLYGCASAGGANGAGTVFQWAPDGSLTALHTFDGADGASPIAPLIRGNDGSYYGTTYNGGVVGAGTIFKITPNGAFTRLYSFTGSLDGSQPNAGLYQAADGNLYGAASIGGRYGKGTIFRITPGGILTVLHAFGATGAGGANADGFFPNAALIQGLDGSLYGAAVVGGANGSGTLFRVTLTGAFTVLYTFSALSRQLTNGDGAFPVAPLLQGRDGNLYGTASRGGEDRGGTLFKLTMTPLITAFTPASGPVGATITLTGINFTEAAAVTIGGLPATFTVNSDTSLTLTVPVGVSSNKITVVNPFGRGLSARKFRVTP